MEERCHDCHETKSFCRCSGDVRTKWADAVRQLRQERKDGRSYRRTSTLVEIETHRQAKKLKRQKKKRLKKRGH